MYIVYIWEWIIGYKVILFTKILEKLKKILYNKKAGINIGVSPSGKASDSDSDIPVFESQYPSQITYYAKQTKKFKKQLTNTTKL